MMNSGHVFITEWQPFSWEIYAPCKKYQLACRNSDAELLVGQPNLSTLLESCRENTEKQKDVRILCVLKWLFLESFHISRGWLAPYTGNIPIIC